jgi:hypothetical protein
VQKIPYGLVEQSAKSAVIQASANFCMEVLILMEKCACPFSCFPDYWRRSIGCLFCRDREKEDLFVIIDEYAFNFFRAAWMNSGIYSHSLTEHYRVSELHCLSQHPHDPRRCGIFTRKKDQLSWSKLSIGSIYFASDAMIFRQKFSQTSFKSSSHLNLSTMENSQLRSKETF